VVAVVIRCSRAGLSAEQVGLQAYPAQDVLGHAQHGVDWLQLLLPEQREAGHAEQRVEGVHLEQAGGGGGKGEREK